MSTIPGDTDTFLTVYLSRDYTSGSESAFRKKEIGDIVLSHKNTPFEYTLSFYYECCTTHGQCGN